MLTILVTGGIGSGKSAVCALLRERGVPVYDCDSRVKELYLIRKELVPSLEEALGCPLRLPDGTLDKARLASLIFSDPSARETLEGIVYPILREDLESWKQRQKAPLAVIESALILSKPMFDGVADAVVLVEASEQLRIRRVMERDGASREEVQRRISAQHFPLEKVNLTLVNEDTPEALSAAVDRVFFDKNSYLYKFIED